MVQGLTHEVKDVLFEHNAADHHREHDLLLVGKIFLNIVEYFPRKNEAIAAV